MKIIPYLTFEGLAEEALLYYDQILKGKVVSMTRFKEISDSPGMPPLPKEYEDKLVHAAYDVGDYTIYFSDMFPGQKMSSGNNMEINVDFETEEELRKAFEHLSKGGEVFMPIEKMFWGAIYGALRDKYGINWSVNYTIGN